MFTLKIKEIQEPGIECFEVAEIGGIKQALYFRGENLDNPVILYLHGGPGSPAMSMLHDYQYPLEKFFTIVHWDQRNAGKTFFLNDPEEIVKDLSFEQVLGDAYEVTNYVRKRLSKDKIILLGHSWGSVLGSALVQTYPQLFCAYIGVGQVVNMYENERVGYEILLEKAKKAGKAKDIEAIEALAPYPTKFDDGFPKQIMAVRKWQAKYDLAATISLKNLWSLLRSPFYNRKEKSYYFKDILNYQEPLLRYLLENYEIRDYGVNYEMPVFYIFGDKDFQTPHPLGREFFDEILSPKKEFFLLANAGHNTMHDDSIGFNRILVEKIRPLLQ